MAQTTYSFTDLVGSIHSDVVGDFIFTGNGVGSVLYLKLRNARHMISLPTLCYDLQNSGNNGTVTIETQQTSPLHLWLMKWFQAHWSAPTSQWAGTSLCS
ncbi:MAG: phage protein [Dialister invisus]|uniref:phage protein n=1 Tax=Dialister invisus TaxID=218538 RepID=UPI0039995813